MPSAKAAPITTLEELHRELAAIGASVKPFALLDEIAVEAPKEREGDVLRILERLRPEVAWALTQAFKPIPSSWEF